MASSPAPAGIRWSPVGALVDAGVAVACYVAAYVLRFGTADVPAFLALAIRALPLMVGLPLVAFALFGVYSPNRILWPVRLVAAALAGTAVAFGVSLWWLGPEGFSRQATGAYALMLVLAGLAWRSWAGMLRRWHLARASAMPDNLEDRQVLGRSMSSGLLAAFGYRHLLSNLVAKDLKLKYRGSVLGFLWSMVNPIVMIAVYTFAFTFVMRVPTERYTFFLLIGITAWGFFASAVGGSTGAISDGGSLIRGVVFPRIILPVSGVLFNLVQYLLTLLVLLPIMLTWHGVTLGPQMLLFPVFLALQLLFVVGLALALSTATAFLRDVKHLVEVGLSITFWLTPVLYEITLVPEKYRFLVLLSPTSAFVRAYQDVLYYLVWPDLSTWLVAVTYSFAAFACGLSVFFAYEDRFAEQV